MLDKVTSIVQHYCRWYLRRNIADSAEKFRQNWWL